MIQNEAIEPMTAIGCVLTKRSPETEIQQQHNKVASNSILTYFLDTMPYTVVILNLNRQIVWANRHFMNILRIEDMWAVLGIRPGEALSCVNAVHTESGCGTAKECQTCGTLQAILNSLNQKGAEKECKILTTQNEALNFHVNACLIDVDGEVFDAVSIVDINDEKNKRILKHLFFHDIMNLAGSIQGFANMLPDRIRENADELSGILPVLSQGADDLIELIKTQKDLLSAEILKISSFKDKCL